MYKHILVPIDGSPTSNAGLDEAVKLAKLTGATLCLMHVVDQMPSALGAAGFGMVSVDVLTILKEAGARILAGARAQVAQSGVSVRTLLVDTLGSRVSDRVVQEAVDWPADLIVIGTHGRRGVGRLLLGSDAEQMLRHATVPVLLVRHPSNHVADQTTTLATAAAAPAETQRLL